MSTFLCKKTNFTKFVNFNNLYYSFLERGYYANDLTKTTTPNCVTKNPSSASKQDIQKKRLVLEVDIFTRCRGLPVQNQSLFGALIIRAWVKLCITLKTLSDSSYLFQMDKGKETVVLRRWESITG